MESFRVIGLCSLIFISASGLGTAGLWVTTRSDELVTLREARVVVRALGASSAALVGLPFLVPDEKLWAVGVFFAVHATLLTLLMLAVQRKIIHSIKETVDE